MIQSILDQMTTIGRDVQILRKSMMAFGKEYKKDSYQIVNLLNPMDLPNL